MNAIGKAVNDLRYKIPTEILKQAFQEKTHGWKDSPVSIEEQIINRVVKQRVLKDCDIVGGSEVFIPLGNLVPERPNSYTTVYHIPKTLTQGRSITSLLSVGVMSQSMADAFFANANIKQCTITPSMTAAQSMLDSYMPIPAVSVADLQLIGENTVMIRNAANLIISGYLRCIVASDEELSHIQIRSYIHFSKLVELAVKSFIYNELIISIDMAQLSGGRELGKFKEIVESYADSEQMYQEFLEMTWAKVEFMNDQITMSRHLKLMMGSAR